MVTMKYIDTPLGLRRLNNGPLDDSLVFTSNAEVLRYCADQRNNIYDGQIVCINYDRYIQVVALQKIHTSVQDLDLYFPIPIMYESNEVPLKRLTVSGATNVYALVYYLNNYAYVTNDLIKEAATNNNAPQITNPSVYSEFIPSKVGDYNSFNMLYLCELFGLNTNASASDTDNMDFIFIYSNGQTQSVSSFNQSNPLVATAGNFKKAASTAGGFITTTQSGQFIMSKNPTSNTCLELYVKLSNDAKRVRGLT